MATVARIVTHQFPKASDLILETGHLLQCHLSVLALLLKVLCAHLDLSLEMFNGATGICLTVVMRCAGQYRHLALQLGNLSIFGANFLSQLFNFCLSLYESLKLYIIHINCFRVQPSIFIPKFLFTSLMWHK